MRVKLVLLTSLAGTVLGAGVPIAIIAATLGRAGLVFAKFGYGADLWTANAIGLISIAVALFGAIFVYRHTARHRKVQAILTGLLILFLSTLVTIVVSLLL